MTRSAEALLAAAPRFFCVCTWRRIPRAARRMKVPSPARGHYRGVDNSRSGAKPQQVRTAVLGVVLLTLTKGRCTTARPFVLDMTSRLVGGSGEATAAAHRVRIPQALAPDLPVGSFRRRPSGIVGWQGPPPGGFSRPRVLAARNGARPAPGEEASRDAA